MARKVKNRNAGFRCLYQDEISELEGEIFVQEAITQKEFDERQMRARGLTGTDEEYKSQLAYADRRASILAAAKKRGAMITMKDAVGFGVDLDDLEARLLSQEVRQPATSARAQLSAPTPGFGKELLPRNAQKYLLTEAETDDIFQDYL